MNTNARTIVSAHAPRPTAGVARVTEQHTLASALPIGGWRLRRTELSDMPALEHYFNTLTPETRELRLHATVNAVPATLLDLYLPQPLHNSSTVRYAVLIETDVIQTDESQTDRDPPAIIGEAVLAGDHDQGYAEIGISISDHYRRLHLGTHLLNALTLQASKLDLHCLYADAYRSNTDFTEFAQRQGFSPQRHPHDWSLVRLTRQL